jgi:flagellar assembly protein FliH
MGKIIDADKLEKHHVKKYAFNTLSIEEEKKTSFNRALFSGKEAEEHQETKESEAQQEEPENHADITELLEKIEALTSDNVSLTMELEELKKNFDDKLKEQSETAYQRGKEEGIKEAQETLQDHSDELNMQLVKSITTLEEQLQKHEAFLESVKEELVESSIIIAKKIIKKEIEEHSHEIAQKLAETFLEELKEASEITLKVNPKDFHYIKEHYQKEKKIKIDADDAINKGGIIILTDIGNIDGNIDTRVEKAIALIQREG